MTAVVKPITVGTNVSKITRRIVPTVGFGGRQEGRRAIRWNRRLSPAVRVALGWPSAPPAGPGPRHRRAGRSGVHPSVKSRTPYQVTGSIPCPASSAERTLDPVAPRVDTQTVDLSVAVEGGQGGGPVAPVGGRSPSPRRSWPRSTPPRRARRARRGRRRAGRDRRGTSAPRGTGRRRRSRPPGLGGLLTGGLDEAHPAATSRGLLGGTAASARSSIDGDGSTMVTS